ncbi:MAG: ATPase domain-containing protein [Nanoarchaeota archaeon]
MKKRSYDEVEMINKPSIKTGNPVLDRFLSSDGGFQLGNLIMLSGTSGAGKTTLCKTLQRDINEPTNFHALESLASSVKRQTKRIEIKHGNAYITDADDYADFDDFVKFLYEDKPLFVMVDSIQHAVKQLMSKGMGEKDAYYHVRKTLYDWKDATQGVVILICQLNKDGGFSGPSGLLFDCDAQIHLEFNPKTGERTMETFKNRMGELDKIYYEFTSDERVIAYYTEAEWEVMKKGATIASMVQDTIEAYTQAFKNHANYKEFKKELVKEYNKIYNANQNDGIAVVTQTIVVIDKLAKIYF